MRTSLLAAATATTVIAAFIAASPAHGAPAAFFSSASGSLADNGALVVSFDERGVGNGNIDYALTAQASAAFACATASGNIPNAANKQTRNGEVSGTGSFTAKNGRVRGTVTAGPLTAGSFKCPKGQHLVPVSVGYTRIVVTDTTNGTQVEVPDVVSSSGR